MALVLEDVSTEQINFRLATDLHKTLKERKKTIKLNINIYLNMLQTVKG